MSLSATAQKAIHLYGGSALWTEHQYIHAEVSVSGLAFQLKRRPFFKHAQIKMEIHRPYSMLTPIGNAEQISGLLEGHDVSLVNAQGTTIAERKNARRYFPYGRRLFFWDDLDMAYFANYAFWNYFTLPALLMNPQIEWKEIETGILEAIFPDHIPTHSRKQVFYFDQTGYLMQHHYTAEIISKLANAANMVKEHASFSQGIFPSHRVVTPQKNKGTAFKRPILIDMKIHDFKLTNFL